MVSSGKRCVGSKVGVAVGVPSRNNDVGFAEGVGDSVGVVVVEEPGEVVAAIVGVFVTVVDEHSALRKLSITIASRKLTSPSGA
jgi:hypothetical protein